MRGKRGVLQYLMPLSTIFQLYCVGHFYWRKLEYPVKTTNLSKVRQSLSHNVVSITPHGHEWDSNSHFSGDRHRLQLPYNHDHTGPYKMIKTTNDKEGQKVIIPYRHLL